jgi:hypothetical protein
MAVGTAFFAIAAGDQAGVMVHYIVTARHVIWNDADYFVRLKTLDPNGPTMTDVLCGIGYSILAPTSLSPRLFRLSAFFSGQST